MVSLGNFLTSLQEQARSNDSLSAGDDADTPVAGEAPSADGKVALRAAALDAYRVSKPKTSIPSAFHETK